MCDMSSKNLSIYQWNYNTCLLWNCVVSEIILKVSVLWFQPRNGFGQFRNGRSFCIVFCVLFVITVLVTFCYFHSSVTGLNYLCLKRNCLYIYCYPLTTPRYLVIKGLMFSVIQFHVCLGYDAFPDSGFSADLSRPEQERKEGTDALLDIFIVHKTNGWFFA